MLVIDTNVIVAGLRSRNGASFHILKALGEGRLSAAASAALLLEYEAVLRRDNQLSAFWLDEAEIDAFLGVLASRLHPTAIYFEWRPQLTDPGDEKVLETAINAAARAIVTHNVSDFIPNTLRFGIEVITPAELLHQEPELMEN